MSDAAFASAFEEIGDGLGGAGENLRTTTGQGAQHDLQAAIATNVIERAPNHIARFPAAIINRTGEARQGVDHQLGTSRGSGREQNPLGFVLKTVILIVRRFRPA